MSDWIQNNTTTNKYKYLIVEDESSFIEARNYILASKSLAIDTETTYNILSSSPLKEEDGALRHDNVLLGISISANDSSAIYLPVFSDPAKKLVLPFHLAKKVIACMRQVLSDETRVWFMHNALFDIRTLEKAVRSPIKGKIYDTAWMAHELDENRSMALKDLCVHLFGDDADEEKREMLPYFKELGFHSIDMSQLYLLPLPVVAKYACKDTILTMKLKTLFSVQLKEKGLTNRYVEKQSMLDVYKEINSVGWRVDRQVLEDNGKLIREDIKYLVKAMRDCLLDEIVQVEEEVLDKELPLSKSPTIKKMLVAAESLESFFIIPEFKTSASGKQTPLKDAGKFSMSQKMIDSFLESSYSEGTILKEFLLWDEASIDSLSPRVISSFKSLRKRRHIEHKATEAKADGKIESPCVFNLSSGQQIANLLFEKIGLVSKKHSKKTGAPDVSAETLERIRDGLMLKVMSPETRGKVVEMLETLEKKGGDVNEIKNNFLKILGNKLELAGGRFVAAQDSKVSPTVITSINVIVFLTLLGLHRDRTKLYGTYVIGLLKELYTAKDLGREPEFSRVSGRELCYVLSNVNPIGTKTGRPACLIGSTQVETEIGTRTIKTLVEDFKSGHDIKVKTHKNRFRPITNAWNNGVQEVYELITKSGKKIVATENHKFLVSSGQWKRLYQLKVGDKIKALDI